MKINIINMPLDYGAGVLGTDLAPEVLFTSGLCERINSLGYNIDIETCVVEPCPVEQENPKAKFVNSIAKSCENLAALVFTSIKENKLPLILGGDHSILLGSLAGASEAAKGMNKKLGVIYIDAHGDFNTCESSPTGNIHGMCLAASCGYGLPQLVNLYSCRKKVESQNVYIIAARDLDLMEKEIMREAGVNVCTMSDIQKIGLNATIDSIMAEISNKCDLIHLSFDIDSVDPAFACGTAINVPGGLTSREVIYIMEKINETGKLFSADFVEFNPSKDLRNQTANLIVTLIAHLLGETYY